MPVKRFLLGLLALSAAFSLDAQTVRPVVNAQFQGVFFNDEFDASGARLAASGTLGAVRLFPSVGLRFGKHHGLYVGVDVIQDFGVSPLKPQAEFAAWYEFQKEHFSLYAGMIPYAKMMGSYSTAIFSDAASFYDGIFEGFMLQGAYERSYWEIALDWFGKYGENTREQFAIYSAGDIWFNTWLALGWEGSFHHFACSEKQKGVVDDHLIHPYLKWDFSSFTGMEKLELNTGMMLGYQADRLRGLKSIPLGADVSIDLQKWGFGLRNEAYYGDSQAPFFNLTDETGQVYGEDLYSRSSLWQITSDGRRGFYDRAEIYWEKSLCEPVSLGVRVVTHFGEGGFLGWQQLLSATVNLERIKIKRK